MVEYSFEWYIGFFIFHILLVNYITYTDQNLIFRSNWVQSIIIQNNINSKRKQ